MIMKNKYIYISISLILIDQIVKFCMELYLDKKVILIDNFFYLNLVYNKGVAWSMLNNQMISIIVLSIICLFVLVYVHKSLKDNNVDLIFTFIYAGAISNFIDRIIHGYVIDYLDVYIFNYDFPVFNLADIFLVLGFVMLIIKVFISEKKEKNNGN